MIESLVTEITEVSKNIKTFNEELKRDKQLVEKLSYFRAWYYSPELDLVGPSKFIGYKDMTASQYLDGHNLDGRDSEYYLREWFEPLEDNTAEAKYVENKVSNLLENHNKSLNKMARFCAPFNWRLNQSSKATESNITQTDTDDISSPMAEIFWRAFLTLYPKDQEYLASRISEYLRKNR